MNNKTSLKTILIALVLMSISMISNAQELKMIEFRADMSMTDAVQFPKEDLNGDRCGLIRLGLVIPDAVFEGDIISSEYKDGEWWIYMPKGSNWLTIKSKRHVPLRCEFEKIQSNVTYIMVVVESTDSGGKPMPTQQYLVFQLSPTNAVLEVNGQLWEVGPDGTAMKFVNFGTYSYRVQAPNHIPETGMVTVNDPNDAKTVNVKLKSDFVEVTLKVDADAEIWVNNEKKGTRTWTGLLGKGTYKIECKQVNHETSMFSKEITAEMNGQTITLPVPKPIYGSLNVESTPIGATIYIDGKVVGKTPKSINEILVGKHEITLTKEGFVVYTETVNIAKSERKQVKVSLDASSVGHDYVDLGLPSGTLWATCNVGANSPEEYGDYFAWGETQPKSVYNWSTYQYCKGSNKKLTKYCNKSRYGNKGFTDNLTTLLPEDDAATANWGTGWCMPTDEQWKELTNNTTVTWATQNGVEGRRFTASNGNTLFLPLAGHHHESNFEYSGSYAIYWSSSLYTDQPDYAWYLVSLVYYDASVITSSRSFGRSVRAVRSARQN